MQFYCYVDLMRVVSSSFGTLTASYKTFFLYELRQKWFCNYLWKSLPVESRKNFWRKKNFNSLLTKYIITFFMPFSSENSISKFHFNQVSFSFITYRNRKVQTTYTLLLEFAFMIICFSRQVSSFLITSLRDKIWSIHDSYSQFR